ncbi:MAG: hypothetical protein SGPRY_008615 [Prymnesium sp.]
MSSVLTGTVGVALNAAEISLSLYCLCSAGWRASTGRARTRRLFFCCILLSACLDTPRYAALATGFEYASSTSEVGGLVRCDLLPVTCWLSALIGYWKLEEFRSDWLREACGLLFQRESCGLPQVQKVAYSMHLLSSCFFFASFTLIIRLWKKIFSAFELNLLGLPALILANASLLFLSLSCTFSLLFYEGSMKLFFVHPLYIAFTTLDALINLAYSVALL